jgi:hypothetical protein
MWKPPPDDDPALLGDVPVGQYLLELVGERLILWRLSEGEPADGALDPAACWPWLAVEVA